MQAETNYRKHPCPKGQTFGRLTLTGKSHSKFAYGQLRRYVEADCVCGGTRWYLLASLIKGDTRSCGCLQRDLTSERFKTHGLTNHPLYDTHKAMLKRCFVPTDESYPDYGGRGITVCELWQESFIAYYEWAIASGWVEGKSVDREDNDGHYCPENCRIARRQIMA